MEHFIRIAFWIVILSGCLQANSLPIHDSNIKFVRQNVTCLPDSTFYTPKNVKIQCITTALDCVARELNGVAKVECSDPMQYIDDVVEFLDYAINKQKNNHPLTNSTECACENSPQTPLLEFLDQIESLLKLQNNENNKAASVR